MVRSWEYLSLTLSVFPRKEEKDFDLKWGEGVENNLIKNTGKCLKKWSDRWGW